MKRKTLAVIAGVVGVVVLVVLLFHQPHDPYAPEICSIETNGVLKGTPFYHFSEEQFQHMAHTPLDAQKFIRYLEAKWPVDRIRKFCKPTNVGRDDYQNLVPLKLLFETNIHTAVRHEFDDIYVYVSEDDGNDRAYYGEAGTRWHRWSYSLNIHKSTMGWAIIEHLPNDFMDRK